MCGIYCYVGNPQTLQTILASGEYEAIAHRGPDNTTTKLYDDTVFMAFFRLAINGLDHGSDQPLSRNGVHLICNGEIYNFRELIQEENLQMQYQSGSDCEIIIHLYLKYGMAEAIKKLYGVYAFVLYDEPKRKIYIGRDPIGIRSLFIGRNEITNLNDCGDQRLDQFAIASEAKALMSFRRVEQFPAGTWAECEMLSDTLLFKPHRHYSYDYQPVEMTEEYICDKLRSLLATAVEKRMLSDRPICCLLSGGLDSSLITALVVKYYRDRGIPANKLKTYAIGLAGSVDLQYARKVANYLGTSHNEVVVSEAEFLGAIEPTIRQIESFCTTSVRASVGNYLVSLFIRKQHTRKEDTQKENDTDDYENQWNKEMPVVVFCGDLADEVFASYRGFQKAPSAEEFFRENVKLIRDVRYFDVLRSDKSISGAGLEARVPFADRNFVNFAMTIKPELKMFSDMKMEKYILRLAFANSGLLPDEILWRRKEAFSDGVSSHERSWFAIIKEYVDKVIPDDEVKSRCEKYIYLPPYDKETLYYREIFEKYYGGQAHMIPYYWRHPFCGSGNVDPSARLLNFYQAN